MSAQDSINKHNDYNFKKFFSHLLTPEEIMQSKPKYTAEDRKELANKYRRDPLMLLDAIGQMMDTNDMERLFNCPAKFGVIMSQKVTDYIESAIEEEMP